MIWWVFESTGLSLGSILSQFDPVVHQAWVDCHMLHICSVFSARRHFYLAALIFSTLTRLVLLMMNQNLKVNIFLPTNGTAPPPSLFLRELSIFSVFILTWHISWCYNQIMIFTRFLSHPHQVLPHNFLWSRKLEIGCRFWTAKVVLLKTILIYFYLSLSFQLRIRLPLSGDPHDARMEMELWVSKTAAALGGSTEPERKARRVSR